MKRIVISEISVHENRTTPHLGTRTWIIYGHQLGLCGSYNLGCGNADSELAAFENAKAHIAHLKKWQHLRDEEIIDETDLQTA
jgi:hypothetical protein